MNDILNDKFLYLNEWSNVTVISSVVGSAAENVDTPVAEQTELIGQHDRHEVEGSDIPEVSVIEACEADVPTGAVP